MTAHADGAAPMAALRTALLDAGYQHHADDARHTRGSFARPDAVPADLRARGLGKRLSTLLELFAYGGEVGDRNAAKALAPATPEALARAGVLQRRDGHWRSRMTISGHDDVFVLGDLARGRKRRDHVDGYTTVAAVARRLAVPVGGGRLLDLGTGSGIHSLLAARGGGSAVGADINAHALRLAALGAPLSGVTTGVQWRQGSWYDAVAGERFDRIICVAPYVVSPDNEFTFRDGDAGAPDPVVTVVQGARAHLAPGGCALVMCCWGHGADEDWRRTPMSWLSPRGADVLLLRASEVDAARYAMDWNRPPMRVLGPAEYDRTMARWLTHYARVGYDRISFGALLVRRRTTAGNTAIGRAVLQASGAGREHAGRQLGRALRNLEPLGTTAKDDEGLLSLAPAIPDGQRVDQCLQNDGARYRLRRAAVGQADGLDLSVAVSAAVLEVVYRLDGRRTLRQALTDVGAGRGAAGRARTDETLRSVRELLTAGLLELS